MQIFRNPYNFESGASVVRADASWNPGALANEVSDRRDDTFTAGGGTGTERFIVTFADDTVYNVDSIFCETAGFDEISIETSDGSQGLRNWTINDASQRRGTRHYANAPIPSGRIRDSSVRITFLNGPGRIYRLAVTRHLLTVSNPNWTDISHQKTDEGASRRTNILGNSLVTPGRAGRWKHRTRFRAYFPPDANPDDRQVAATFENNPNMFAWPFPTEDPTVFYPATIDPASLTIDYIGGLLTQRELGFVLQEL